MKKYKNILVACDSNPVEDAQVLECVEHLKESSDSKVSLVHVLQTPYMFEGASDFVGESQRSNYLCDVAEKMQIDKDRIYIKNGEVGQRIIHVADSIDADLIVLGNHGRHGISSLFFGNTGSKLMGSVKCDVLAHRFA